MAMNFGEALAQGITKGIGVGGQQYFADMRRKRLEREQMDNAFDAFTKQKVFAQQLGMIEEQRKNQQEWERAAKLQPEQLAYEISMNMSKDLAPTDRPMFIRDSLKRMDGMKMPALLSYGGYSQADYTPWINDPAYKDAIPQANMIGSDEPDDSMERMYQYQPEAWNTIQAQKAAKLTDAQRQREYDISSLNQTSIINNGAPLSSAAASYLLSQAGGAGGEMVGDTLVNNSTGMMNAWLQSGVLVNTGTKVMLSTEIQDAQMAEQQGQQERMQTQPQAQPMEMPKVSAEVYQDPARTEAMMKRKEKEYDKQAVELGKSTAKTVGAFDALNQLDEMTRELSPEAQNLLFGAGSIKDLIAKTDAGLALQAKYLDVAGAKEARKYLSSLSNIVAKIKHDQYGASQTKTELANFAQQLGNPSVFQNIETLQDQINSRRQLVVNDIKGSLSAYSPEVRDLFATRHDSLSPFLSTAEPADEEIPEGTPEGTDETVSDMSTAKFTQNGKPVEIPSEIMAQFEKATPEQQQAFLKRNNLTRL